MFFFEIHSIWYWCVLKVRINWTFQCQEVLISECFRRSLQMEPTVVSWTQFECWENFMKDVKILRPSNYVSISFSDKKYCCIHREVLGCRQRRKLFLQFDFFTFESVQLVFCHDSRTKRGKWWKVFIKNVFNVMKVKCASSGSNLPHTTKLYWKYRYWQKLCCGESRELCFIWFHSWSKFLCQHFEKKSRTKTFNWQESSIQNAMQLQTLIQFLSGAKLEAEFAVALHSWRKF